MHALLGTLNKTVDACVHGIKCPSRGTQTHRFKWELSYIGKDLDFSKQDLYFFIYYNKDFYILNGPKPLLCSVWPVYSS